MGSKGKTCPASLSHSPGGGSTLTRMEGKETPTLCLTGARLCVLPRLMFPRVPNRTPEETISPTSSASRSLSEHRYAVATASGEKKKRKEPPVLFARAREGEGVQDVAVSSCAYQYERGHRVATTPSSALQKRREKKEKIVALTDAEEKSRTPSALLTGSGVGLRQRSRSKREKRGSRLPREKKKEGGEPSLNLVWVNCPEGGGKEGGERAASPELWYGYWNI